MGSAGEVADFSAGQGQSNQKMYIIIGALVALIAVGVGLKFLLPTNDKAEEKTELVVIDPNVKAYMHDVELVGQKGNTGLVNLHGENTLDWLVLSGAALSDKRDRMLTGSCGLYVTMKERNNEAEKSDDEAKKSYDEAKKSDIPVVFKAAGEQYKPSVITSNKLRAEAGDGWNVFMRVPKSHKGSMLVNLYMLQEWCGFDVEINLGNDDVVDLFVPALDAGVTHIPIEIPNAKGGKFYNIKITASKGTTGDFVMGLCAVHVEKR
jgi:hypothetical protein